MSKPKKGQDPHISEIRGRRSVMPRCKTCIHFKALEELPEGLGECTMQEKYFSLSGRQYPTDRMVLWTGGDFDRPCVGENFGCIHHKKSKRNFRP